ncbi:MAG TPA: Asp-tRNA(Asn)/Glu-tRNA(Gln) amidotransferase GatCAB subunit B, partial [Gammaproteobacteria bacterium]|nr:Asp-tRNA(Asn)/Glu-tRNA(Gln) amidotransferase GatCAB subunit B [Gammaproteobacteria bacterium]
SKEEANDYRYFPDPDLLPVEISDELMSQIMTELPELPSEKKARYISEFELSEYDAGVLTSQKSLADYFEKAVSISNTNVKLCANWIMGDLLAALNKEQVDITNSPICAEDLSLLVSRIDDDTISGKIAKDVFKSMWNGEGSADEVIKEKGLKQITDSSEIESIIDSIIAANAPQVEQFKSGNEKIIGFFVGQAMKATGGKANPKQVNELLRKKLT